MKKLPLALFVLFLFTAAATAQTEVETFVEKARQFSSDGKFNEAVAEISKAISAQPNNAEFYLTRANYYLLLDKNAEVLGDAQKAVSLNPTDKKILYFSAQMMHRSRNYGEALKVSDSLIALGDVDKSAWSLRIQIKTYLEDFVGAYEDATTAAGLFPRENMFKQNQANLIRLMGNSEKALEMYNALIVALEKKTGKADDEAYKRDISSLFFSRSGIHFAKSNAEAAKSDLIKAVNYLPTEFSYLRRAKIYKQQKMYAESLADLNKALEINKQPEKIIFLIERGDVYFLMKNYKEAIADYEEIITLDEAQMKEPMQRRIELAKQKMRDGGVEPQ
jgi:tetratricopeptide (TPR) repeat protein